MNKKKKFVLPKTPIKITVFQALTLLAKQYRLDQSHQEIDEQINTLYLSGVRNANDTNRLNCLLQDKLLADYIVSDDKKDINEDPVRRYFESQLCHQTLMECLDLLDVLLLEQHFNAVLRQLTVESRDEFLISIKENTTKLNEYTEGIRILDDPNSYQSFKPEKRIGDQSEDTLFNARKEKMNLLAKCTYGSTHVDERSQSGVILLDIYDQENSVYAPHNRGRVRRFDSSTGEKQRVRSHALGIMRAYMPLPVNDALYAENVSRYTRSADIRSYAEGSHQIPDQMFSTKVTPFINSISGTMLIHLRVIAQLLKEHQFVYTAKNHPDLKQKEQFNCFLKSFIAYLLYHTGGHSLDEYMRVFQLPEVQQEFKKIPHFSSITLDHLFQHENITAFNHALDLTIEYNDCILKRKKLQDELLRFHEWTRYNELKYVRTFSVGIMGMGLSAFSSVIGACVLHSIYKENKALIMGSSALGGALLFPFMSLIYEECSPLNQENKADDLGLKELLWVACMVSVSAALGARLIGKNEKIAVAQCIGTCAVGFGTLLAGTVGTLFYCSVYDETKHKEESKITPSRKQAKQ